MKNKSAFYVGATAGVVWGFATSCLVLLMGQTMRHSQSSSVKEMSRFQSKFIRELI